jgi:hypothetical protein
MKGKGSGIGLIIVFVLGLLWWRSRSTAADPGTKFKVGDRVQMRTDLGYTYVDTVVYTIVQVDTTEELPSKPGIFGYYTANSPGSSGKYTISSMDYLFQKVG